MSTTENNNPNPAPYSAPVATSGNKGLTYLLYAMLIGLVGLLGYRAIKMKNEKTAAAKAEAEYQQLLTETGYPADDTTSGVAKPNEPTATTDSKPLNLTEPNAANGIAAATGKALSETAKKAEKAVESAAKTTAKAVKTDTDSEELVASSTKSRISGGDKKRSPVTYSAPKGGSAKQPYMVVAASFANKEGARKVMETLVKKGYADAEVTKLTGGKYWIVVADRTKTEADAKKAQAEVAKIKDCEKAYVRKVK